MDRRVELDGPGNFRDLGGLPLAEGGSTRPGMVYRADRLSALSDADLVRLEAAGIRHVFDLRSAAEVADSPDRLPAGASYVHLPMTSDRELPARTIFERIAAGDVRSYGESDMVAGYVRMLENFGPSLARIAGQVAEGEPTVVHCTAGKDRTGVAAMLLLDLAGVGAQDIVADYALSAQRRPSPMRDQTEAASMLTTIVEHGLDPADFAPMWEARPAVMAATLDRLHTRWSGAAAYLDAMGLDARTVDAARACLIA